MRKYDGLNQSIKSYLNSCSIESTNQVIAETAKILKKEPFVERRHFEISEDNSWMLGFAATGCERLAQERSPSALSRPSLTIVSLAALSHHYGERDEKANLSELVPAWTDLNDALFWYDVEDCRSLLDKTKGERLVDWWHARIFRDYSKFTTDDLRRVLSWITEKPFVDDRLVALTLAFKLYVQAGRPRAWRERLKQTVAGEPELEERLNSLLNPPAQTEEEKRWKRSEAAYKQRHKKREAAIAENNAAWKEAIPGLLDKISDREPPPKGKYWTAQGHLFERMRDSDRDSGRWAQTNWRDLAEEYGQDAAKAMRDGLMAKWRRFTPELASEIGKISNITPSDEVFGLSGLEIEAAEIADWPALLTEREVRHVARYFFSELNGFPTWFRKLYDDFPKIVLEIVSREIEWELFKNPSEGRAHYVLSDISWHAQWLGDAIAPVLLDFLTNGEPGNRNNLCNALLLILSADAVLDDQIAELCAAKVKAGIESEHVPIWFAGWVSVRLSDAIEKLRSYLASITAEDAVDAALTFVNSIYGSRSERGIGARENHKTAAHLREIFAHARVYSSRKGHSTCWSWGLFANEPR